MKKFVSIWLLILGIFSIVSAQSGRKVLETPTPTPATVVAATTEDTGEKNYSDSAPVKLRTTIPSLRSAPGSTKTQNQASTEKKDGEVLEENDEVLKVETNLITIPVSVFDRNGLYIPNLGQDNFKIFEDGVEQEIAYFGTTEQPFTVVLLLDTSPSTEYKIEDIQDAAVAFVNQLKPQDSVIVIEFAWNVHVLSELTTDRQKIFKGIKKADWGDGTSLYEAVNDSLGKRLKNIKGKKAIVLFTDGVDTTSYKASYDSTLRLAEESDVTIFPIYYNTFADNSRAISPFPFPGTMRNPRGTSRSDYALGKKYLDDLALVTGGRVFPAESYAGGLKGTFEAIAEELRRQYNIGYYPQEVGQSGQRKQIRVRVNRGNLIIRARDSYIVGTNTTPQPTPTPTKTQ
ncbi:MAG TPA: VWA domain-containing protein [Pyrinomonadaceae bacterium]|jgi:VWFA-related protein